MHVQGNMIRPMSRDGIPYMVHLNHPVPLEMDAYNKSLSRTNARKNNHKARQEGGK
jgi:hypothetical protein